MATADQIVLQAQRNLGIGFAPEGFLNHAEKEHPIHQFRNRPSASFETAEATIRKLYDSCSPKAIYYEIPPFSRSQDLSQAGFFTDEKIVSIHRQREGHLSLQRGQRYSRTLCRLLHNSIRQVVCQSNLLVRLTTDLFGQAALAQPQETIFLACLLTIRRCVRILFA